MSRYISGGDSFCDSYTLRLALGLELYTEVNKRTTQKGDLKYLTYPGFESKLLSVAGEFSMYTWRPDAVSGTIGQIQADGDGVIFIDNVFFRN